MRKGFTRKPQPDAPATLTKNYITPSGLQRLKDEHRFLLSPGTAGWPTLGAITKPRLPHPLRFSKGGYHGCRHLETTPLTSSSQSGRAGPPSAPSLNLGCPTLCGFQRVGTTDVGILRLLPSHHPLSSDTGKISSCNLSGSHPFAKNAKGWGSLNLWLRKRVGHPLRQIDGIRDGRDVAH